MPDRDDFERTVRAAATGQLSDGQVATITRAADAYRASALTGFAERLDRLAYDVQVKRRRGLLGALRASLATEAHWLAAGMARAAAAQPQDAIPGPAAGDEQGEWLEPRTDGYSAARKGSP